MQPPTKELCNVLRPDPYEIMLEKLISQTKLDLNEARDDLVSYHFNLDDNKQFGSYIDALSYIIFLENKLEKYEHCLSAWRTYIYGEF